MLLSYEEFQALINTWYAQKNPTERLGQYLLNNTPLPLNDAEIFYGENDRVIGALYHDRYVVASEEFTKNWIAEKTKEGVPKVDVSQVKAMINGVEFTTSGDFGTGYLTICTLTTFFGFKAIGKSDSLHEKGFNESVGRRMSLDRALSSLIDSHAYLERYLVHHGMNFSDLSCAISEYRKNR